MAPDLSIVVVNFNSAHFIAPLLDSIAAQDFEVAGRPGRYEVIIVDNASRGDDAARLEELRSDRVAVILNTANVGYGPANNQGFHLARGRYHMILNPDARFLDGCFRALIDVLERDPEAAVVGPLAYMDPEATCMMPPNEAPSPELIALQTLAQTDHEAAARNLRERTRFAHRYWAAEEPIEMEMLSGSCLVFRRELYATEWPFDPGYPLYFEDSDLFLRLRRAGRKLLHVPAARMLHYWSQSADRHVRGAQYRHRLSARRFFLKHFGEEGLRIHEENLAQSLETHRLGRHIMPFEFEEVATGREAPAFDLGQPAADYFVEFAGNPIFTLAIGMFPRADGPFQVSQIMWEQVGPGTYYIRAVSRRNLETLKAWKIRKG
ncbi:MAG: glycosyltransferase family 2 protein [Planctomycetes bacterium]|nr:glycosyltransferase family 2 protein [Planctomycetota bacterium]